MKMIGNKWCEDQQNVYHRASSVREDSTTTASASLGDFGAPRVERRCCWSWEWWAWRQDEEKNKVERAELSTCLKKPTFRKWECFRRRQCVQYQKAHPLSHWLGCVIRRDPEVEGQGNEYCMRAYNYVIEYLQTVAGWLLRRVVSHQRSAGSVSSWTQNFLPGLGALHLLNKCESTGAMPCFTRNRHPVLLFSGETCTASQYGFHYILNIRIRMWLLCTQARCMQCPMPTGQTVH